MAQTEKPQVSYLHSYFQYYMPFLVLFLYSGNLFPSGIILFEWEEFPSAFLSEWSARELPSRFSADGTGGEDPA